MAEEQAAKGAHGGEVPDRETTIWSRRVWTGPLGISLGGMGALAALVAVTRSMTSPVTVTQGVSFTIFALIVTVVGGLGSVAGAFLAGIILGIVNTVSSFYIGTFLTYIILLSAAALTILLRPSGLLGVPE